MSSALLFFLICASFLVLIAKKTRIAALFSFLTVMWFVFNGFGFLPELLLTELQSAPHLTSPEWKQRNLIILLGGGKTAWTADGGFGTKFNAVSRVLEAARLYNSCKNSSASSCRIAISGGDPTNDKVSEAFIMSRELTDIGIPQTDLILEDKSYSTFQNAKFLGQILKPAEFDQIFLVTSGYHIKRSQMLFSHFGIQCTPAPADRLNVRGRMLTSSGQNFLFADLALHEYAGMLQFYLYNLLGWNS